jgi:hypothetical protein
MVSTAKKLTLRYFLTSYSGHETPINASTDIDQQSALLRMEMSRRPGTLLTFDWLPASA